MTKTPNSAAAPGARRRKPLPGLRQALPIALGAICLWLVAERCQAIAPAPRSPDNPQRRARPIFARAS